jgi:hypothetical protein
MRNSCTLGLNQSWPVTQLDLGTKLGFGLILESKLSFFLEPDGIDT